MSTPLDRERERNVLKKMARQFRSKCGRDPTPAEVEQFRQARLKSILTGRPVKVPPPAAPQPAEPQVEIEPIGRFTETGIEFEVPVTPDMARRASFYFHSNKFQTAKTHAEQLRAAQGVLIGLMNWAGVNDALLEAPAIIAMLADIDDMLAGRDGRLLQGVADPVLPEMPERMEPSNRWIASAHVVALGMAIEKFADLTKGPALEKAITDLEQRERLNGPIGVFFSQGKEGDVAVPSDDLSKRRKRIDNLVKRFGEDHKAKLVRGDVPNAAKLVFDLLLRHVEQSSAAQLKAEYPVLLMKAEGYIRQAKERPDTKQRKGGSRRVQAMERKQLFSTAD